MMGLIARFVGVKLAPWLAGAAVLLVGGALIAGAVAIRNWDAARLQERYETGYGDAAAQCREAQLETKIANLQRDLAQARKRADEESFRNSQLSARLAEVEEENASYADERAKGGALRCPADDPAVAHDRRLRGRSR